MQITGLKKLIWDIADRVEKVIKETYSNTFHSYGDHVAMGADGTPTQWIDRYAEDIVLEMLADTKINILSEESGYIEKGGDYTLVLDPIDGTRNAVHHIPFYAISIALGKNKLGDVHYGLVRNIPTGDTYSAEKGKGAWLNMEKICVTTDFSNNIISPVLGPSGTPKTYSLVHKYNIRSMGSAALEMCLVANGSTLAYLNGKELLRSIDIAAATLIVREAGGEVYNARGEKLDMPLTLKERASVLAVSSPELRSILL
jgi:fructose-1,6-bisphosphatase/inositol monophosphatase family enzyme